MTDAVVVGAGLAGLASASYLHRQGHRVVVLDPAPPGGRARTDDRDGFMWNRGPHALYLDGAASRVLSELGVAWNGAPPGPLSCSFDGRVGVAPVSVGSLLSTPFLGLRGRAALAKVMTRVPRIDAATLGDRTLDDWVDGLGLPADAERVLRAVTRIATYAHAPSVASADIAVLQMQQSMRSGVRYLDGGWQTLVDGLAKGLDVRPLAAIAVGSDGRRVVVDTEAERFAAAAVVIAVATPGAAAGLLGGDAFAAGPPIEAACLDLATARPSPTPLLLGLDEPLYLSDHGVAAQLAPHGQSVVHVARYLAPAEAHDPATTRAQLEGHAALAGLGRDEVRDARYLHRMTVVGALPTAALGGMRGRPADSRVHGVLLAGDWVGPEGHLLDAAMASAREAARRAARLVDR